MTSPILTLPAALILISFVSKIASETRPRDQSNGMTWVRKHQFVRKDAVATGFEINPLSWTGSFDSYIATRQYPQNGPFHCGKYFPDMGLAVFRFDDQKTILANNFYVLQLRPNSIQWEPKPAQFSSWEGEQPGGILHHLTCGGDPTTQHVSIPCLVEHEGQAILGQVWKGRDNCMIIKPDGGVLDYDEFLIPKYSLYESLKYLAM